MTYPSFQAPAAVASIPLPPANPPAALADEAGKRSNPACRFNGRVVGPIQPCDGWTLMLTEEWDSDGFVTDLYYVRSDTEDRLLNHCRFGFTPTQARFDWIVRNGFPQHPKTSWSDAMIDAAMAAQAAQA